MDRPSLRPPRAWIVVAASIVAGCSRVAEDGAPKAPATAPEPQVGTEVHRRNACEPDPSGWCSAKSTRGGFSVLVPGGFDDFTTSVPLEGGGRMVADTIALATDRGVQYTAIRARRSDGKPHVASLEEIAVRIERSGQMTAREDIRQDGKPALDIRLLADGKAGRLRSVLVDGTLFQASVQFPVVEPAPETVREAEQFLDSLRVFGPSLLSP